MKAFEYAAAHTEAQAIELLLARTGRSEILAGGTDLMGLLRTMVLKPDRVVNIMEIPTLHSLEVLADGGLSIGAAVSLEELYDSPYLDPYSSVKQVISNISSMQLRCQGTVGGEICQRPQCWFFRNGHGLLGEAGMAATDGDNRFHAIFANNGPAKYVHSSRLAPAFVANRAQVRVIGPRLEDEITMDLEDLFRIPRNEDQRETVLGPQQLVTHIYLPVQENSRSAAYEVRHGTGPEYPLSAAAATLRVEDGIVAEARIVLGQVAPVPWRALEAEQFIVGRRLDVQTSSVAGEIAVQNALPMSNNSYKVQLAKVSVERALLMAAGLPTGGF